MVEITLFLQIQSINIIYSNKDNMILVPITKGMEIIIGIQVCLISWMNLIIRKIVEITHFLQIQSINSIYSNKEIIIVVPITKRMEIIMSIEVCLIAQMNFD